MAITAKELRNECFRAYQTVQAEHNQFRPTTELEPGGPGGVKIANTYHWTCTFDPEGEPQPSLEDVQHLAKAMEKALQVALRGHYVKVKAPILDGTSYRIFLRVESPGTTLTIGKERVLSVGQ